MSAAATALTTAYLRLADDPPVDPSTGKGPEWGKASPVGLLVILLLAIATFFLLRSMTRRLKRVQDTVNPPPAAALAAVQAPSVPVQTTSEAVPVPEPDPPRRSDPPPG